jgi:hypothetical protein
MNRVMEPGQLPSKLKTEGNHPQSQRIAKLKDDHDITRYSILTLLNPTPHLMAY